MKILGMAEEDLLVQVSRREFDLLIGQRMGPRFYPGQIFDLSDTFSHVPQIVEAKQRLASAAETLRGLATVLENVDVSIAAKEVVSK